MTVDDYIAQQDTGKQSTLRWLRSLIREHAPAAVEAIEYKLPFYRINGHDFSSFAAQKHGYSLYIMVSCGENESFLDPYRPQLGKLSVGKGCIRFKKQTDLDERLAITILSDAGKYALSHSNQKQE